MLFVCSQHNPAKKKKERKETELGAGSSTGEASISGAEPGKSAEGFKYTHIQMGRHRYTDAGKLANPPNTLWYLLCDQRAYKSFAPSKTRRNSESLFSTKTFFFFLNLSELLQASQQTYIQTQQFHLLAAM